MSDLNQSLTHIHSLSPKCHFLFATFELSSQKKRNLSLFIAMSLSPSYNYVYI